MMHYFRSHRKHSGLIRDFRGRSAFTLTEMLVAITVLLVVILATSSIFSTAQKVSSVGEANSDILQQANAIERVIRQDFDRLSRDGFFAVQCVGVPNTINEGLTGRLLDPSRDRETEIRSDQLFFFTEGLSASTRALDSYADGSGDVVGLDKPAAAQSYFASVFYSPGVQVKILPINVNDDPTGSEPLDIDREKLDSVNGGVHPWSYFTAGDLPLQRWPSAADIQSNAPLLPESTENWILCRQSMLLADDDGSRLGGTADVGNTGAYYMAGDSESDPNSALTLFYNPFGDERLRLRPALVNSRVDIAATERDTLRQEVCYFWNDSDWGFSRPNTNQGGDSSFIASPTDLVKTNQVLDAMYYGYPRGELRAPSMRRADTMLTNAVLGSNVSDFRVEWTWSDGVGRDHDVSFPGPGNEPRLVAGLPGVVIDGAVLGSDVSIPWFGLSDADIGSAPASAFMDDARGPADEDEDSVSPFDWSHIGDPGGQSVRIGPPVGTEIGNDPYLIEEIAPPFGLETNETLSHIEFSENGNLDPERPATPPDGKIRRYGAVFGFNAENPILRTPAGEPVVGAGGTPVLGTRVIGSGNNGRVVSTYTPWPTAVRISFRLHDSEARLDGGRFFEFIIPLPRSEP